MVLMFETVLIYSKHQFYNATNNKQIQALLICTSWWCCKSAGSGSTGTDRTSWLGCRAAVCADSTTPSRWQRTKLYLQPFAFYRAPSNHSVSMHGQTQGSKWHLFISLSPPLSTFLLARSLCGCNLLLWTSPNNKQTLSLSTSCLTLSHLLLLLLSPFTYILDLHLFVI